MVKVNKYFTTPIYYVNSNPHIGTAYTSIVGDIFARFYRMLGNDVFFLTGTDEHGQKIERTAISKETDPMSFVTTMARKFKNTFSLLDISYDHFIRTTDFSHKQVVVQCWELLKDLGYIYIGHYEGWYDVRDEAFFSESDLVDGKSPTTGGPVEWVQEPSYFFKLSAFAEPLLKWYKENPDAIQPKGRMNEVIKFVEGGLNDLSISRTSFKWGIPVPQDPDHVIYVWLDALVNYISGIGFDVDNPSPLFKKFWPEAVHFVGKDILRFHAVYWPAFLMAMNVPLPKTIFAHGWITNHGEKMSKSLGNVLDPIKIIQDYGLDAFRYYLVRDLSFGYDGEFSVASLKQRYESELSNNLGNLAQRVLSFAKNHFNGVLIRPTENDDDYINLLDSIKDDFEKAKEFMDNFQINRYVDLIINAGVRANKFVDEQKPWDLKKQDSPKLMSLMYTLVEYIRRLFLLASPIIPKTYENFQAMFLESINFGNEEKNTKDINLLHLPFEFRLGEIKVLFPKL